MSKPVLRYNSKTEQGNIFNILAIVYKILQKEGKNEDIKELQQRVMSSTSYKEALKIINEKVELIDTAEK